MAHRVARESDLEQWAVKEARKRGYYLVKWTSPSQRGVPDRILLRDEGRTTYIEFKRPGKKLTPLQVIWRDRLLKLGHEWVLCNSKEKFLDILEGSDAAISLESRAHKLLRGAPEYRETRNNAPMLKRK